MHGLNVTWLCCVAQLSMQHYFYPAFRWFTLDWGEYLWHKLVHILWRVIRHQASIHQAIQDRFLRGYKVAGVAAALVAGSIYQPNGDFFAWFQPCGFGSDVDFAADLFGEFGFFSPVHPLVQV